MAGGGGRWSCYAGEKGERQNSRFLSVVKEDMQLLGVTEDEMETSLLKEKTRRRSRRIIIRRFAKPKLNFLPFLFFCPSSRPTVGAS